MATAAHDTIEAPEKAYGSNTKQLEIELKKVSGC